MSAFTTETGGGIRIYSAGDVERAVLEPDSGLTVSSSDASPIVDGISDMFRIQATGTLSRVVAANAILQVTDVTIVGPFDEVPMVLASIAAAAAPTNRREFGIYGAIDGSGYGSSTSVGFTAQPIMFADGRSAHVYAFLAGAAPNDLVVRLEANDKLGAGYTAVARYYVLVQEAI